MKRQIDEDMNEEDNRNERKSMNTAFILMFPTVILAGMAALYAPVYGSLLAIALAVYQFLMLKQFITDFYRSR